MKHPNLMRVVRTDGRRGLLHPDVIAAVFEGEKKKEGDDAFITVTTFSNVNWHIKGTEEELLKLMASARGTAVHVIGDE